jgi:hypothetical protein
MIRRGPDQSVPRRARQPNQHRHKSYVPRSTTIDSGRGCRSTTSRWCKRCRCCAYRSGQSFCWVVMGQNVKNRDRSLLSSWTVADEKRIHEDFGGFGNSTEADRLPPPIAGNMKPFVRMLCIVQIRVIVIFIVEGCYRMGSERNDGSNSFCFVNLCVRVASSRQNLKSIFAFRGWLVDVPLLERDHKRIHVQIDSACQTMHRYRYIVPSSL